MNRTEYVTQKKRKRLWIFGISVFMLSIIITIIAHSLLYKPIKHNIYVQNFGAKGNGIHDDTEAIQKALTIAKTKNIPIKVIVPKGTYKLTKTLHIYKNTHLVLNDRAVFLRCHEGNIMINGDINAMYSSYDGQGDISIEGGIWDGNILKYPHGFEVLGIARGKNITIRNIEVKDVVNTHAIDLNASENVLIENCKFLGFKDATPKKTRYFSEAIQISEHTEQGFKQFGRYDGTPNKSVTVRNCYFGKSKTKGTTSWPVGVGNHITVYDKFNSSIKIYNNIFDGMTFAGIRDYKWKNTLIKKNTFLSCNRGVALSNPDGTGESSKTSKGKQTYLPQSSKNTTIIDNIFKNTLLSNIYAVGWAKGKSIAKVESINIAKNIFINQLQENKSPNMYLSWVNNVSISNNKISKGYLGLYISFGSNVHITNNEFNNITNYNIATNEPNPTYQNKGYTSNILIDNNTLSNLNGFGILIEHTSNFKINKNNISTYNIKNNNELQPIIVSSNCNGGKITDNTVKTSIVKGTKIYNVKSTCKNIYTSGNLLKVEK